jgi:hypothetical protein
MAAMSAGKVSVQNIFFLGFSFRSSILNGVFNKSLPCCSYATFVGKAASSMMRNNRDRGSNQRGMNRSLPSAHKSNLHVYLHLKKSTFPRCFF